MSIERICMHRVYVTWENDGTEIALDEMNIEHVQKLITDDYREWQLNQVVYANNDDKEWEEIYGWWEIL